MKSPMRMRWRRPTLVLNSSRGRALSRAASWREVSVLTVVVAMVAAVAMVTAPCNGFFLKKRIRPVLSAPVYHQRIKRPSSTGYGEKSFLDLCQSEMLDHIQVEMRQVWQLVCNDNGIND